MNETTESSSSFDLPDAARTLLRHFDPEIKAAYRRLSENHSPEDADILIQAIVLDHLPMSSSRLERPDLSGEQLKFVEDLGLDSVAMAEIVFFCEDLFQIRITNDEISELTTMGNLRSFIRFKLDAAHPSEQ